MDFEDFWAIIVDKNKNLQTDKEVAMSIKGFKKALKLAYDKGYEEGDGILTSIKASKSSKASDDKVVDKLMGMFGIKK